MQQKTRRMLLCSFGTLSITGLAGCSDDSGEEFEDGAHIEVEPNAITADPTELPDYEDDWSTTEENHLVRNAEGIRVESVSDIDSDTEITQIIVVHDPGHADVPEEDHVRWKEIQRDRSSETVFKDIDFGDEGVLVHQPEHNLSEVTYYVNNISILVGAYDDSRSDGLAVDVAEQVHSNLLTEGNS